MGQFLVVKRNGNIPTLVGMNEFSASCAAKDLRKIPFHTLAAFVMAIADII